MTWSPSRAAWILAHVRATTGTPIQQTNCHPFRHGQWLFVHNGLIRDYARLRRELAFVVAPALYPGIEGTTDSELMFNLALTFGLETDPIAALERMAGLVESTGAREGVEFPLQMTLGVCNGQSLYAVRYSSERNSRTLYHNEGVEALQQLNPALDRFSEDARVVVSEPLTDTTGAWVAIPESTALKVEGGEITMQPFTARPPT